MKKPAKPVEPYTEAQAIAALKRLAKRWPKSLWMFCGTGTNIMRCRDDGSRAMTGPRDTGCVDQDYFVCKINIPSDGGDW